LKRDGNEGFKSLISHTKVEPHRYHAMRHAGHLTGHLTKLVKTASEAVGAPAGRADLYEGREFMNFD